MSPDVLVCSWSSLFFFLLASGLREPSAVGWKSHLAPLAAGRGRYIIRSVLLRVRDCALKLILAFKGGDLGFRLVAVAEGNLVELQQLLAPVSFDGYRPFRVVRVPCHRLHGRIEDDIFV